MKLFYRLTLSLFACLCLTYDANGLSKPDNWWTSCQDTQCEAVIDAGSSGTRLHVFQKTSSIPSYQEVFQQKIEPGLSQVPFVSIDAYLKRLFPMHHNISINTYFYATAGMRLLSIEEQNRCYMKIKDWFAEQTTWELKDIRTISGQEEGAFAWLAVNQGRSIDDLQAVIEFGGASAQINIPITDAQQGLIRDDNIMHINFKGQRVNLWSKSYLGLGINEAEKHIGNQHSCFSIGYPLKNGQVAEGDATNCIQGIEANSTLALLNRLDDAKQVLALLKQPIQWMALGSIYYTAMKPPFKFNHYEFTLDEFKHQADDYTCHQDWLNLLSQYREDPFLYRNCLAASYFYAYMVDGMGIDVQDRIRYPEQNETMDWAFGVVLTHQS